MEDGGAHHHHHEPNGSCHRQPRLDTRDSWRDQPKRPQQFSDPNKAHECCGKIIRPGHLLSHGRRHRCRYPLNIRLAHARFRSVWKTEALTITTTNPTAAVTVNHDWIPVTVGAISPSAPSNSATPIKRTNAAGKLFAQVIFFLMVVGTVAGTHSTSVSPKLGSDRYGRRRRSPSPPRTQRQLSPSTTTGYP